MATPFQLISRDAQDALREFSTAFDGALALAPADIWSKQFGLNYTGKFKVTFPLSISAAGYRERKGDDKMRSLYEKSLDMLPKEWSDGVAEKASIIEAPDFIGWGSEPGRIALEGNRHPNLLVSDILHNNPVLDFYKNSAYSALTMFHASHPINVFDPASPTFANDVNYKVSGATGTGIIDSGFLKGAKTRFRTRKGPNGRFLGLQFTHLLVNPAREQEARDALENDLLITTITNKAGSENVAAATGNNRMKGAVTLVVGDELQDDNIVYCLDASRGCYPWIVQDGGAPEQIIFDKSDAMYKANGKVGVKYVLTMGAAAALPQAIERVNLA